jgi:hypothetical protein
MPTLRRQTPTRGHPQRLRIKSATHLEIGSGDISTVCGGCTRACGEERNDGNCGNP